jgi:hypothetical protein
MTSDLDRWFATEILPHEAALTRYVAPRAKTFYCRPGEPAM